MKRCIPVLLLALFPTALAHAQARAPQASTHPPPPPPPVYPAPTVPGAGQVYVYDQKPLGGRSYLISPEQAQSIISRFKEQYQKLGSPRMVIYVNRELIDQNSGMKLSSLKQVVETTRTFGEKEGPAATNQNAAASSPDRARQTERVASTNIYRIRDHKEAPLADRQTVRDVERLFARPLRMAGVHVADQKTAAALIGSKPLEGVMADNDQARKDREALAKIADVVLEILVSSKDVHVSGLSGEAVYPAPDIQATAIRLSDARILGQATAADLIGQGASAGAAMRNFGVREVTEATALSLMEDMMLQ